MMMEIFDYQGWQFLCSGEQLPSGLFHATVRCKAPPRDQILTLALDSEKHETASAALQRAKELAIDWITERDAGDRRLRNPSPQRRAGRFRPCPTVRPALPR